MACNPHGKEKLYNAHLPVHVQLSTTALLLPSVFDLVRPKRLSLTSWSYTPTPTWLFCQPTPTCNCNYSRKRDIPNTIVRVTSPPPGFAWHFFTLPLLHITLHTHPCWLSALRYPLRHYISFHCRSGSLCSIVIFCNLFEPFSTPSSSFAYI